MLSFLFVDSFNLLELVLWCIATAVVVLSALDYFVKKEKKKLLSELTKAQNKSHVSGKESAPVETEDDLDMLDL